MGGEVIGINTETFDGNEDAIKEAAAVLESQGQHTAIFPLTLLQMQVNMLLILWHSLPQF